jgi:hypothetical protein
MYEISGARGWGVLHARLSIRENFVLDHEIVEVVCFSSALWLAF